MNRGAGHTAVLASDADRALFLSCLGHGLQRYHLQAHAYCLMTTHYHLLVRSEAGLLSDAMRFISGRFTRLKNLRDDRDGPLFRGRFASVNVTSDAHLIQASRYIHLNPLKAGLCSRAEDWPWSSAAAYLSSAARPTWLETEAILAMFGQADRVQNFAAHLQSGIDRETSELYAQIDF